MAGQRRELYRIVFSVMKGFGYGNDVAVACMPLPALHLCPGDSLVVSIAMIKTSYQLCPLVYMLRW